MYNVIDKINLCFIGCGKICAKHAKLIKRKFPEVSLSFASNDINKARAYANKYKGLNAFGSYDEVFLNQEINVIMITTPPQYHSKLTEMAIVANKHVLVEKPPFYSSQELYRLGRLAHQKNLQLLICENYYYKPLRKHIEDIIKSNVIGSPILVSINASKKQENIGWRLDKAIMQNGALFEGGIHWINFINNIGLILTDVDGKIFGTDDLEKTVLVSASSKQGPLLNLFYSWETDTILKGIRFSIIYGTEGSVTFESNGIFIFVRGRSKSFKMPLKNITGFFPMFDDFFKALKSGKDPQLTLQMVQKDMELIEYIYNQNNKI